MPPVDVHVVLVGTTHPGNIGAAARAMKVMGLSSLRLVSPALFPHAEATARAAGADDILARAEVHESLPAALHGCGIVYGTTARARRIGWPAQTPREAAADIVAAGRTAAIVFGRERSGLSNEELDCCQRAVHIPTAPDFRSLNLAQAVQICAYELHLARTGSGTTERDDAAETSAASAHEPAADAAELERVTAHCLSTMTRAGYHDPDKPKLLERRLARLFSRAGLLHSEAQILRGFFRAVDRRLGGDDD